MPMLLTAGVVVALGALALVREDGDTPASAQRAAPLPPVVFVLMDEFPVDALGGPGRIDAARYPNFAALARTSFWFPNTHAVHEMPLRVK